MLTSYRLPILLFVLILLLISCGEKKVLTPSPPTVPPPSPSSQPSAHLHMETKIPTPLAKLSEPILDLHPVCELPESSPCLLLLLYRDRLELFDWRNQSHTQFPLSGDLSGIRSRAPVGKIVRKDQQYILLHSEYARPLCFTLTGESCDMEPSLLPKPEPGLNFFTAGDGKFYDFELLPFGGIAVIETSRKLSLAEKGTVRSASEPVGGSLAVHLPALYTSAPVLPGPDTTDRILKFVYESGQLHHEKSIPVTGEILDLCVTNINRDPEWELLITVRNQQGIFIEVMNVF